MTATSSSAFNISVEIYIYQTYRDSQHADLKEGKVQSKKQVHVLVFNNSGSQCIKCVGHVSKCTNMKDIKDIFYKYLSLSVDRCFHVCMQDFRHKKVKNLRL